MNHGAGSVMHAIWKLIKGHIPHGPGPRWNPWGEPEGGGRETKPRNPPKPPKTVEPPPYVTPKRTNSGRNSA